MNSSKKSGKRSEIEVADLYALKAGKLWSALKNENISLWMLCIYFFFEYVRPQSLYPALDILPWTQIFLISTFITAFLDPKARWVGNPVNKLMLLFGFIIVLSGIFAFRPQASLDNWTVFGGWLMVYFLVITIVNTEQRMILFLVAYCLFNLKMSQHGAIGWTQRGFSFASYGLIGAPGWFRNSGEYAIQMLIYGSLAISIVIALKDHLGKYKKWIMYAVAATGYMAVMGASSRGAQIALAVIGIWMLLKMQYGLKSLAGILVFASLLFYLLPDEQMQRFMDMGQDTNSLQRLSYWEYAINEIIPRHPVLGIGYHNWMDYLTFKVPEGVGPLQMIEVSHNIYIQATSELGFTGLIFFLLLVLYAFINNYRTRINAKAIDNRLLYHISYGLDAGLIGFLVAGSFVTVLYYPFFWIQISMIVMLNNISSAMINEKGLQVSSRHRKRNSGRQVVGQESTAQL